MAVGLDIPLATSVSVNPDGNTAADECHNGSQTNK
jgi:hypothetical protein